MSSMFREYFPSTEPEGLAESLAPFFSGYQALRNQLTEILTDDELSYQVGGANPSLGSLCREIAEIERSYIESLKTFRLDFDRNADPRLESSVAALSSCVYRGRRVDAALRTLGERLTSFPVAQLVCVLQRDTRDLQRLNRCGSKCYSTPASAVKSG